MVLPFLFAGRILAPDGTLVAAVVPCSVWPATSMSSGTAGRHYTHGGEADLAFAAALRVPNRFLELLEADAGLLAGRYKIVRATPMELLPHVILELNATSGM